MKLEDLPARYRQQAERQLAVPRRPAVPVADLERAPGGAPLAPAQNPVVDTPCRIRVLCRRHRLADPDGISVKAVLDGLVLAGILAGDSAREIVESPVIVQERVGRDEPEETIVEIYKGDYTGCGESPDRQYTSLPVNSPNGCDGTSRRECAGELEERVRRNPGMRTA